MSYATITATISGYATSASIKETRNGNDLLTFKVPVEVAEGVTIWYQVEFWNGSVAPAMNRFQSVDAIKGAKITLSGSYKATMWKSDNGSGINHVISNPTILEFYPKKSSDEGDDTAPLQPRTDNPYEGTEQPA
jgi:hypothetical protein